MINFFAKIVTMFIPDKVLRRKLRNDIYTRYYARQIYKKTKNIGKNFVCNTHHSFCNSNTKIGDNVNFGEVKIYGDGKCEVGNYCQFGENVCIITQNHNYDSGSKIPYDNTYIYKEVIISDFVWVGTNVTILPGTKIGEGAIIQAGAVVHGEIPPCAIVGGNPAKVFKYRDIEHFKKLKEEKKFLGSVS